jgi:hypothetical protein
MSPRAMALWAIPLIWALEGCATQIEALKIVSSAREVMATYKAFIAPIETKPEYARIYEKLGIATTADLERQPSRSQLTDSEKISDGDIASALTWYSEVQRCDLPAIETMAKVAPEFQIYFTEGKSEIADLVREVVTTKPTYAQINQKLFCLRLA